MNSVLVGIKNIILWSHGRGTWQYDALCMMIVLSVFLVPSSYFGDRDREHDTKNPGASAANPDEIFVEAADLDQFLKGQRRTNYKLEPFTSKDGKVIYKVRFK